ncbi:surface lipoprotein assembly modifier [Mangrovimicrobium sediminis]|nr:surface lipoprotein assembly modifier [Haliea sp. SAOS-164]
MQRPVQLVGFACALAAGLAAGAARAAGDSSTSFSAEIGLGAEYDSNVSVDELDASSNQGDYAGTLDAELKLKHEFNPKLDTSLTYNFSETAYEEFDFLDRQTHLLGLDFAGDLGPVTSGLTLHYINARLDGEDFLEYYRASPYASGFLAKKWFLRGAYVYSDKSVEQNPGRDSLGHAGELDVYFFRRGLRSYFNVGYKYKHEDAEADRYDYTSSDVKVRYVHRWDVLQKPLKFELGWRYEYRDYSSVTPSIGEERLDKRQRWKTSLDYPVFTKGNIELYGGYADYDSNYPSADYEQYVVGTRVSYSW